MVTTRSADKRTNESNKLDLALRSRSEENGTPVEPSDVEASPLLSATRKGKISVNVPPRKRTRQSYNLDNNTDPPRTMEKDILTRDEVPDSQESPAKSNPVENFQTQVDFVALDEPQATLSPQSSTSRKRKVAQMATATSAGLSNIQPEGEHKRFGSEDPSEVDQPLEEPANTIEQPTAVESDDDEDDAPEVTTSKNTPTNIIPRTTRKPRVKKPVSTPSVTPKQQTDPDQTTVPTHQPITVTDTPSLNIDTTQQDNPSELQNDSQDSDDSAFATAQSSRHVDVFSTPTGGTPQLRSPTLDLASHGKPMTALQQQQQLVLSSRSVGVPGQMSAASRSVPRVDRPDASSRSPVLPRKAGNSLEKYRRQMLDNRAETSAGGRRGGGFKLQEEWNGKRRKFVVGY